MNTPKRFEWAVIAPIFIVCFLTSINMANAQWSKIGSDIDGEAPGDNSGWCVSLSADGTIVAVGARNNDGNGSNSGHVRIFKNIGGNWTQQGADINGEAADDQSGFSVSLSADGSIIAIGANGNDGNGSNSGHVRVYKNIGGVWTQQGADINGEAAEDQSGRAVSLSSDGSIVAIGAVGNDGNGLNSGHVRVFKNVAGIWTQQGADIDGEAAGDNLGRSVSISADGSIVACGANGNSGNGTSAGHVRIYKNIAGTWTQQGADIDGEAATDNSAWSISLSADGSIVAIGAIQNDGGGSNSGHVRIYKNIADTWTQQGADIDGEAANDNSGRSVSLSADGSIVAIGADGNDGNGSNSGHARLYAYIAGTWTLQGTDINGESAGDFSGTSVALSASGNIIAIGAIFNDGNGSDAGHARVYRLCNTPLNISFSVSGLKPFWTPATDPYTFYWGLVDAKRINANVSGGVGPYTYTWSGSPWLKPRSYYPPNSIDLFHPKAATTVYVDVTDLGTGCTYTGSVFINWDNQYNCKGAPGTFWNVVICEGGITKCVPWQEAKTKLSSIPPTATLGACAPLKADPETQVASLNVYPNPSSGLFTLEMPIAANSKGSVEVMDVNGRALHSESLDMQEGVLYHTLDLGTLPNGIYIVRVATDNEFATERIQIIR